MVGVPIVVITSIRSAARGLTLAAHAAELERARIDAEVELTCELLDLGVDATCIDHRHPATDAAEQVVMMTVVAQSRINVHGAIAGYSAFDALADQSGPSPPTWGQCSSLIASGVFTMICQL